MPRTVFLPAMLISPTDVGRLLREARAIDEFLNSAKLRKGGEPVQTPRTSKMLDEFASGNNLNMLEAADRKQLIELLNAIKAQAPVVHMSFSVDPPMAGLRKIIEYLRREINPLILVRIGLQPNIGAGVVLRTRNHYFDFSLRKRFDDKRDLFLTRLQKAVETEENAG